MNNGKAKTGPSSRELYYRDQLRMEKGIVLLLCTANAALCEAREARRIAAQFGYIRDGAWFLDIQFAVESAERCMTAIAEAAVHVAPPRDKKKKPRARRASR